MTTTAQGVRFLVGFNGSVVWAIEDRCSHADCLFSTDGEVQGTTAICDCHGSEFDVLSGEVLMGPATEPIRTFPARVIDGVVEVRL